MAQEEECAPNTKNNEFDLPQNGEQLHKIIAHGRKFEMNSSAIMKHHTIQPKIAHKFKHKLTFNRKPTCYILPHYILIICPVTTMELVTQRILHSDFNSNTKIQQTNLPVE